MAPTVLAVLGWALLGLLLIALAYQVPALHDVAVGYNDAAYVQGFADPTNRWGVVDDAYGTTEPFRRSTGAAALVFPQLGLPAEATVRWRSATETPTRVRVLQGGEEVASVDVGPRWTEDRFAIGGGLFKPNDVVLELRAEPADGLLVQRAELRTAAWPVVPYPAQLMYAALAAGFGALLLRRRVWRTALVGGLAVLFLLLYRMQLTPFPLRGLLPGAALLLGGAVAVRALPRLERPGLLAAGAAAALIVGWFAWILTQAHAHVVLSLPGVERDFPVFVSRAAALICPPAASEAAPCVLRADGFYQLGYPLLLWIGRLAFADVFVAARWIAAGAGLVTLLATWALGLRLLRPAGALVAVAILACSPLLVQYALYLGTDMPFVAAWTLGLAALLAPRRHTWWTAAAAGVVCGLAFLLRHPGLVLLPFGVVALYVLSRAGAEGTENREPRTKNQEPGTKNQEPRTKNQEPGTQNIEHGTKDANQANQANQASHSAKASVFPRRADQPENLKHETWNLKPGDKNSKLETRIAKLILFIGAWLLAVSPQLIVNVADTGNPLWSRQAKNIWLAVYADIDYSRWSEAGDDIALSDLVLADPQRFFGNWGRNLKAFVGAGGEDTSEFGHAIGLRLLGFPANVLAFAGLGWWLWRGGRRERLLVLAGALYLVGVAVGFALPRFFVPLAPIMALAAVAPLQQLARTLGQRAGRLSVSQWGALLALALLYALAAGPRIGARYVLDHQDQAAAAIVRAVEARLEPGDGVRFLVPDDDLLDDASSIAAAAAGDGSAQLAIVRDDAALPPPFAGHEPFATAGAYRAYDLR